MSERSSRPGREEIKAQRKETKRAQKILREEQKNEGLTPRSHTTISNRKSEFESVEEEQKARNDALSEQVRIIRSKLPVLLKPLSKIEDPRNPKKTKHKLTVLMLYEILAFVFQMSSLRETDREMTRPEFMRNLKFLFPELEDLPHHDTITRLLSQIDVMELEQIQLDLVRDLIRKKKFRRYLIDNCHPIAIDGTQKIKRAYLWAEECLERTKEGETQYYVYVLEAVLAFPGGMMIPFMSEFLDYNKGDLGKDKQDCEQRALHRLATRLKEAFPALPIMLLLDGLYANGPVIKHCRDNNWQYMIVLKDKELPTVMEEFEALSGLEPNNWKTHTWGNRRQSFRWANQIEYCYGPNGRQKEIVHVVECNEEWEEVDKVSSQIVTKTAHHMWLSNKPLDKWNLHERCNLGARSRWSIENGILVEKHHGYQYEHCFSYDWNAMRGYHYLMRLAHLFNTLSHYSQHLAKVIRDTGVRGFIRFIRETMAGRWLDYEWLEDRLREPFQLRIT